MVINENILWLGNFNVLILVLQSFTVREFYLIPMVLSGLSNFHFSLVYVIHFFSSSVQINQQMRGIFFVSFVNSVKLKYEQMALVSILCKKKKLQRAVFSFATCYPSTLQRREDLHFEGRWYPRMDRTQGGFTVQQKGNAEGKGKVQKQMYYDDEFKICPKENACKYRAIAKY